MNKNLIPMNEQRKSKEKSPERAAGKAEKFGGASAP